MADILGLDTLFAQMVLALGLALLLGNGYAWVKNRRGERPAGAEGELRTGRVAFLLVVGVVMTIWGAISVFGG